MRQREDADGAGQAMLRAVVVSTADLSESSAAPTHLAAICDALHGWGYLVELLATTVPSPESRVLANVASIRTPRVRLPGVVPSSASVVLLLPLLVRALLARRVDLFYIRCASATFPAVLLARLLGARLVVSEHNGWIRDELDVTGHSSLTTRAAEFAQVLEARMADVVRVVVPEIATKLTERGVASDQVVVAGNGTRVDVIQPRDRAVCLSTLGLPADRLYVGFLGKLSAWQGVDQAIVALGELSQRHANVDLLIAGDGSQRQELASLADRLGLGGRVIFLGEFPPDDLSEVLGAFDVALAPKTTVVAENGMSPLKVRDYAAAGRPVVAPAVAGLRVFEEHGWLACYEPHNAADLTDVIEQLLLDPRRRIAMGQRARTYAVEHFDWTVTLLPLARRLQSHQSGEANRP